MNSTKWVTLTAYAKYLGSSGKCRIEETPKGFYLEYIERDPELVARQVCLFVYSFLFFFFFFSFFFDFSHKFLFIHKTGEKRKNGS